MKYSRETFFPRFIRINLLVGYNLCATLFLFAVHFYNYISDGWDSNIFPRARFVSEYGFQSIPSVTNLQLSSYPYDKIESILNHRQHFPLGNMPIMKQIQRHLNLPSKKNPQYLEALVYFSQLSQAIATKTETETYR